MANTYNAAYLKEVAANSTSATTGEIRVTEEDVSDESDWSVTITDSETTPEDQPFFVVSKMEGTIVVGDYDFGFTDTMSSGNTIETAMVNNNTIFVQLVLQGGTLSDSSGNTWFEVKPRISPVGDVSDNEMLLKPQLEFIHSDYGGAQSI